jgi:hypothetical protein
MPIFAAGPQIRDTWWETPALQITFFWNLESRRDGAYATGDWPEEKLMAADTFLFGLRQAYLDMDITGHIAKHHNDRVWIAINNTQTSYPDIHHESQYYDYPPHINVHLPWRDPYWNDINGHFYTTDTGQIDGLKYAYTNGDCPKDKNWFEPGEWMRKRDSLCEVVYEERFTTGGEIQLRINAGSPIYTLRNKGVSDLDILRGGKLIYNVQNTFYDASIAKAVWKIIDYQQQQIITETIIANPDTGRFTSHTRESKPLAQAPNAPPTVTITAPNDGAGFMQGEAILIESDAVDSDGQVTQVTFYAGSMLLGTATSAPWQWLWRDAPAGFHSLSAVVTDDHGATTAADAVTITVNAPSPETTVSGSVTLQRLGDAQIPPHPSWQMPLSVRLFKPGEITPAYTFTPTIDASGNFDLAAIAPGAYLVAIKQSNTLQNVQHVMLAAGSNRIDFGTLRAGDADDSNRVTLADFSILTSAINHCAPSSSYDARADFNADGCLSLFDFSLLSMNYGEQGDLAPDQLEVGVEELREGGTVHLRLRANPPSLQVGQQFTVTIEVEAVEQVVDVVGAYLNFDPALIQVLQITSGATLKTVLRGVFDNQLGTLDFEAGKWGSPFPSGSFSLATIHFKVIGDLATSPIAFNHKLPRQSAVYQAGMNQLGAAYDGIISSESEPNAVRLYLPLLQHE